MRDETMRTYKTSLSVQQQEAEKSLSSQHRGHLDLEIRKFQRRKRLQRHEQEKKLLQDVCVLSSFSFISTSALA